MKRISKAEFFRKAFDKDKNPGLYSKRGFEKKRIKYVIPKDNTGLIYCTDNNGNKVITNEL